MNKNAVLFIGLVVLCAVVVIVINISINSPDKETMPSRLINLPKSTVGHQHVSQVPEQSQVQATAPADEQEPKPEYEATVSNGTILF